VTAGSDRRETGTHYTPTSLTESIVATTLDPIVYVGITEGKPREECRLKSSRQILDLKICDPAMGSGAFLVQVCRYLGRELAKAWRNEESAGKTITVDGEALEDIGVAEPISLQPDERLSIARRLVAERCLYGVDLNPLAVELAKLSIWLITLSKGRPFEFLDHNIRCGDSLLGIQRLEQLTELSMTPGNMDQQRLFGRKIGMAVRTAIALRTRLRELPIRDIHDVEAKRRINLDARYQIEMPEQAANAFVGAVFAAEGSRELEGALMKLSYLLEVADSGDDTNLIDGLKSQATRSFHAFLCRPFHWPLEFPEVFERVNGGFDAIVSNPPFMHGRRISTNFGSKYLKWLCKYHDRVNASADLVAYFALRMYAIARSTGTIGFIATKSIAEGDTRETSLEWLLQHGASIAAAKHDFQWPGEASVRISTICIWKNIVPPRPILNNQPVKYISALLTDDSEELSKTPHKLIRNKEWSFTGTYVYGEGFILTPGEKENFVTLDPRNLMKIKPYLRGQDINQNFRQVNTDYVIDFEDLSVEKARQWPFLFDHLVKMVKPERDKLTKQIHEQCFWKHWDKRPELYSKLKTLDECLVHAFACKHLAFTFVSSHQIFASPTTVIPTKSRSVFAVLQSSIHWIWVVLRSSKMKQNIRYASSDCFQTFPMPKDLEEQALAGLGTRYESLRNQQMEVNKIGLTAIYNLFHDPAMNEPGIAELRSAQVEMDRAVLHSYGLDDVELCHGFFETQQGIRFTVDAGARRKILGHLFFLNQQCFEEESALRGHSKASKKHGSSLKCDNPESDQHHLNLGIAFKNCNLSPVNATIAILNFLESQGEWRAKAEIIAATSIDNDQWKSSIDLLISKGVVDRQGERRGARYKARKGVMEYEN